MGEFKVTVNHGLGGFDEQLANVILCGGKIFGTGRGGGLVEEICNYFIDERRCDLGGAGFANDLAPSGLDGFPRDSGQGPDLRFVVRQRDVAHGAENVLDDIGGLDQAIGVVTAPAPT